MSPVPCLCRENRTDFPGFRVVVSIEHGVEIEQLGVGRVLRKLRRQVMGTKDRAARGTAGYGGFDTGARGEVEIAEHDRYVRLHAEPEHGSVCARTPEPHKPTGSASSDPGSKVCDA
jgi:hypothetical protein